MLRPCRVCRGDSVYFYGDTRTFYRCVRCHLVFTEEMAAPADQERHYKKQWGNASPEFWRGQANGIMAVARMYLSPARILDFGSGSGELARELQSQGLDCTPLEPMIHGSLKDQRFAHKFDLIIAVEVIEHLLNLWDELRELEKNLAPGGVILFTTLLTEQFIHLPDAVEHFKGWWYKDDPTHVSFFCNGALEAMGNIGGWEVDVVAGQVIVLRRMAEKIADTGTIK